MNFAGFLASLFTAEPPDPVLTVPARSAPVCNAPAGSPWCRSDGRDVLTPDDLPADWRAWYEERAAVREYDGGQAREHAEAEALRETLAAMRESGVIPFDNNGHCGTLGV